MTIHAAKGLEFPIVFVVNLHLPGRGRPSGFSVIERGPDGEPDVAFGTSEATRLEDQREQEELRRLCYVAVTRARDRLYLAAEVDPKGKVRRSARSLASLFPQPLIDLFAAAVAHPDLDRVTWQSSAGAFVFDVCRPGPSASAPPPAAVAGTDSPFDTTPLRLPDRVTVAATAGPAAERPAAGPGSSSARLMGTIVHRLLQRRLDPLLDEAALTSLVAAARPRRGTDRRRRSGDPGGRSSRAVPPASRTGRTSPHCWRLGPAITRCRSRITHLTGRASGYGASSTASWSRPTEPSRSWSSRPANRARNMTHRPPFMGPQSPARSAIDRVDVKILYP